MTLRIRSLLELPVSMREQVRGALQTLAKLPTGPLGQMQRQAEANKHTDELARQLALCNLGHLFQREYRFHDERQWKLDFYAAAFDLGIECHGSVNEHDRGRHLRGSTRKRDGTKDPGGFVRDREKMNAAVECGIRVLEFWPAVIYNGQALAQIQRVIVRDV